MPSSASLAVAAVQPTLAPALSRRFPFLLLVSVSVVMPTWEPATPSLQEAFSLARCCPHCPPPRRRSWSIGNDALLALYYKCPVPEMASGPRVALKVGLKLLPKTGTHGGPLAPPTLTAWARQKGTKEWGLPRLHAPGLCPRQPCPGTLGSGQGHSPTL